VSFIQPPTLELLPHPFFIATEGMGDARLIDNLLEFRAITTCSVGCPSRQSARNKTGKDAFPEYLASIQFARQRATSVPLNGLLVVADADDDATAAFNAIKAAMSSAEFPAPVTPFSIEGDKFRVGVYLLPGANRTGTLEHLLLDAAFANAPKLERCLEEFSGCTGVLKSQRPNKLAKMRMSVLAGAFCEDNPWCTVNLMLCDPNNPVPINSAHFDNLADFLIRFVAQE